ncbi:hypothetical protein MPLSOD_30104 [Mesorhizobium sp. SOD10]|nr:hypothetical protein MPLSOD_30104 [Mesorhizobium sp. SOD10]
MEGRFGAPFADSSYLFGPTKAPH